MKKIISLVIIIMLFSACSSNKNPVESSDISESLNDVSNAHESTNANESSSANESIDPIVLYYENEYIIFGDLSHKYTIDIDFAAEIIANIDESNVVIGNIQHKYTMMWKEKMEHYYNAAYEAMTELSNNPPSEIHLDINYEKGIEYLEASQKAWQELFDLNVMLHDEIIYQNFLSYNSDFGNYKYSAYRARAIELYEKCVFIIDERTLL